MSFLVRVIKLMDLGKCSTIKDFMESLRLSSETRREVVGSWPVVEWQSPEDAAGVFSDGFRWIWYEYLEYLMIRSMDHRGRNKN